MDSQSIMLFTHIMLTMRTIPYSDASVKEKAASMSYTIHTLSVWVFL